MHKAGSLGIAAELGIAIVAPDTSPRGEDVANDDSYDLGQGASFYLNASQAPWHRHYQMYDYVVNELPQLIESKFPVSNNRSIAGHSMGGQLLASKWLLKRNGSKVQIEHVIILVLKKL